MSRDYSLLEQQVLSLFTIGDVFSYKNRKYKTLLADKPRPATGNGECKTDCYILAEDISSKKQIEFKISCKLPSNEFQENKITAVRAEEILGPNWSEIIEKSSRSISQDFEKLQLVYFDGFGRTKNGFITLGWKCEIASKKRKLSAKLFLSDNEIRNYIYKGVNLPTNKKNSLVGGNVINNSGIAEYMLVANIDSIQTVEDVLNKLILIDDYIIQDHFLIFTANSYRIKPNRTDGNRHLAVRVEWEADTINNQLIPNIKYDHPLDEQISRSTSMKEKADIEISKLNASYLELFK